MIGNGSDNILDLIARSFVGLGNAGHTIPSYSLYPVVVGMSGGDIMNIPFDRSMKLPVDEIIKMDAPVFYLTNPNAPTGVCFDLESIELVLSNISGLLVVDEAYIDFGGVSAVSLMSKYKNIIIVRSFSKSYSLAGLRVGFALASSSIIAVLDKVRDAYNVSCISQVAATAAYLDKDTFTENCQKIIKTRNLSEIELSKMKWKTYPSKGNYLFTEPIDNKGNSGKKVAKEFYEFLKSNKILVRYFENNSLTCSFIRVSIGTDDNMAEFFRVIRLWQKTEQQK